MSVLDLTLWLPLIQANLNLCTHLHPTESDKGGINRSGGVANFGDGVRIISVLGRSSERFNVLPVKHSKGCKSVTAGS